MTFTLTWPRWQLHLSGGSRLPTPAVSVGETDGCQRGRVYRLQAFQFDGAVCWVCPLRSQCIAAQGRQGRRVLIHPQDSPCCRRHERCSRALPTTSIERDGWMVEHRGAAGPAGELRQSRYFGRSRRNSSCTWLPAVCLEPDPWWRCKIGTVGQYRRRRSRPPRRRNDVLAVVANCSGAISAPNRLGQLWSLILFVSALLPKSL